MIFKSIFICTLLWIIFYLVGYSMCEFILFPLSKFIYRKIFNRNKIKLDVQEEHNDYVEAPVADYVNLGYRKVMGTIEQLNEEGLIDPTFNLFVHNEVYISFCNMTDQELRDHVIEQNSMYLKYMEKQNICRKYQEEILTDPDKMKQFIKDTIFGDED